MKAPLVPLLLLLHMVLSFSHASLATENPGGAGSIAPSMIPLEFSKNVPFWVDRRGGTHPDLDYFMPPTTVSPTETLFTPRATEDHSRISVTRSTDGILQTIVRSDRKNNVNTVMKFSNPAHLTSQLICRESKCFEITPQLCGFLLDEAKVSSLGQVLTMHEKCNTLSNAFQIALERANPKAKTEAGFSEGVQTLYTSKAWNTSNQSLLSGFGAPAVSSFDQIQQKQLSDDQLSKLNQQQSDILRTCANYTSEGVFKPHVGGSARGGSGRNNGANALQ